MARSINNDTYMRWNQYIYLSQQHANSLYNQHLHAEHNRVEKVEEILAELEDYGGTTLGELLSFMHAFNLRFASANSFRQRRIYMKLYPMLLEQVNGRIGTGAQSGPPAVAAAESAGSQALGAAENLGSKAVEGLKSAAIDFFKDMDWKHLSGTGTSKPAARQP